MANKSAGRQNLKDCFDKKTVHISKENCKIDKNRRANKTAHAKIQK